MVEGWWDGVNPAILVRPELGRGQRGVARYGPRQRRTQMDVHVWTSSAWTVGTAPLAVSVPLSWEAPSARPSPDPLRLSTDPPSTILLGVDFWCPA